MTNAYCDLEDVKSSLSGDVPNMGASFDGSLVKKILEVSRDIDRKVAECRSESDELFSFLAEQQYGRQKVYLSSKPVATAGTFVLSYEGQVTSDIAYDASAVAVSTALEALSTIGAGNVEVTGFPGGPWTVDFAGTLTGPRAILNGQASVEPVDATIVVLPMIQGVSVVPSERLFRATNPLYGELLVIDDCVEVQDVRVYGADGTVVKTMTRGTDYLPFPLRGLPVEALKIMSGSWPEWPSTIGVVSRWGHRLAVPEDVREATVIEVIRGHFAAQANNDDRLGTTPFGSVITAKAFTSKFKELVSDYGRKLW